MSTPLVTHLLTTSHARSPSGVLVARDHAGDARYQALAAHGSDLRKPGLQRAQPLVQGSADPARVLDEMLIQY